MKGRKKGMFTQCTVSATSLKTAQHKYNPLIWNHHCYVNISKYLAVRLDQQQHSPWCAALNNFKWLVYPWATFWTTVLFHVLRLTGHAWVHLSKRECSIYLFPLYSQLCLLPTRVITENYLMNVNSRRRLVPAWKHYEAKKTACCNLH